MYGGRGWLVARLSGYSDQAGSQCTIAGRPLKSTDVVIDADRFFAFDQSQLVLVDKCGSVCTSLQR